MALYKPDAFFWTGDIVYPKCKDLICVEKAYDAQYKRTEYTEFSSNVPIIDGVYDDHDFGENDGGKSYPHKYESKELMLQFLNVSDSDIRKVREGAYHSLSMNEFGQKSNSGRHVKIIFLDTRFFRDPYRFFPESQYVARTLTRMASGYLGFGWDYDGDMLGEAQWKWLEAELLQARREGAEATIVVSSVQVFTTFPVFESWGHFPRAKQRLFELIQETKPPGLVFVSGDVHFGEFSGDATGGVLEVTSSGLTHSAASLGVTGKVIANVALHWPFGNKARARGVSEGEVLREGGRAVQKKSNSSLLLNKNFAIFDLEFLKKEKKNVLNLNVGIIQFDEEDAVTQKLTFYQGEDVTKRYNFLSTLPSDMREPWSFECVMAWIVLITGCLMSLMMTVFVLLYVSGFVWENNAFVRWRRRRIEGLQVVPQNEHQHNAVGGKIKEVDIQQVSSKIPVVDPNQKIFGRSNDQSK